MHRLGRVLLVLWLLVPVAARAQEHPAPPQVSTLAGVYAYDDKASDDLGKAISAATRGMFFLSRPLAELKLHNVNVPYKRLEIRADPDSFAVKADNEPELRTPLDGAWVKWAPKKGGPLDTRTLWEDGGVRQMVVGKNGKRVNRFWLSGDGKTLTVDVQESSPRLPRPLEYQLVYRRVG